MQEVSYKQGMTIVWSDGEKLTLENKRGIRWVKDNIENIFGMGEWDKIHNAIYFEVDHIKNPNNNIRTYECVSGYIPQRVIDDLVELDAEDQLPEDVEHKNTLEALRNV